MDTKEFLSFIKSKQKEIDELQKRRLPVMVGRMAKDHFQDNFRRGGFVNRGLHPWQKSGRLLAGGTGAASNYSTLLSGHNHLFDSIKYVPSNYRVKVSNDLVYAPVHNWGGTIPVTDRMRGHAWKMFYLASGKERKAAKGQKKRPGKANTATPVNPEADFWKRFALTKKSKIRMPQRQFLGESEELTEKIRDKIENELNNILNL